ARKMIQLAGLKPDKDIEIVYTGLRSGEKLDEELLNDGEKVLPTHHDTIHIARVNAVEYEYAKRAIYELAALNERKNSSGVVRKMEEIVAEFVSETAPFEALDSVC